MAARPRKNATARQSAELRQRGGPGLLGRGHVRPRDVVSPGGLGWDNRGVGRVGGGGGGGSGGGGGGSGGPGDLAPEEHHRLLLEVDAREAPEVLDEAKEELEVEGRLHPADEGGGPEGDGFEELDEHVGHGFGPGSDQVGLPHERAQLVAEGADRAEHPAAELAIGDLGDLGDLDEEADLASPRAPVSPEEVSAHPLGGELPAFGDGGGEAAEQSRESELDLGRDGDQAGLLDWVGGGDVRQGLEPGLRVEGEGPAGDVVAHPLLLEVGDGADDQLVQQLAARGGDGFHGRSSEIDGAHTGREVRRAEGFHFSAGAQIEPPGPVFTSGPRPAAPATAELSAHACYSSQQKADMSEPAATGESPSPGGTPSPPRPPARPGPGPKGKGQGRASARDLLAPAVTGDSVPQKVYPPIEEVENGDLRPDDLRVLIDATVAHQGLDGGNVDSFDQLISQGIPEIITQMFKIDTVVVDNRDQTPMDRLRTSNRIQFQFTEVELGRPTYAVYPTGQTQDLYPQRSRLTGRTYAAPLTMAAEVTLTATYKDGREEVKRAEIPTFKPADVPIMLGCAKCHTRDSSRPSLKELLEDPNEPGGYFVAKSQEWVVDLLENIRFNSLHVHRKMKPNEVIRGEFISQPGGAFENSSQVILRYMRDQSLTIEISSTRFTKVRIPFFIIYRLFGMTSDYDIVETIAYDPASSSPVARRMVEIADRALHVVDQTFAEVHHELNPSVLIEFVAGQVAKHVNTLAAYKTIEDAVKYLNEWLLKILDKSLLPHIGRGPEHRPQKLRFLGMLWHKVLLVEMGVLPPTDRDSYRNKRVHGAGKSIAKAIKTHFNNSAVTPIQRALKQLLRSTPFEEITPDMIRTTFKNPLAAADLSRTLEQAITSGNKTIQIRRRAVTNRVSSQVLERKSQLNYLAAIRTVNTHNASKAAKQTERADMMRRVHPSYTGYICVCRSNDTGEKVGMSKELAITAGVCPAGEGFVMKLRVLGDPAVTPVGEVRTPDILRQKLSCVFVNGEWLGCCASGPALATRYRALRREGRGVDPLTSIVWDPVTGDVDFWLDDGRLTRPLLIVDNNLEAYDQGCFRAAEARRAGRGAEAAAAERVPFVQNVRFTREHLRGLVGGRLTLEDLRAEGVVEWVTPEEAENCLIAESLEYLRRHAGDVTMRYTHCDVPQAILGLAALVSPLGEHTQPARVTYETNQGRQAGGWYSFAVPHRVEKNRFFQHYTEAPLVRTHALNYVYPNGVNTRVAYMIYYGWNQEDSGIVSKGFVDRGGFGGSFYRYEKSELEKGEAFGAPNPAATKNLRSNASYEKLVGGFVPVGTVVRKNDVVIGKYAKNTAPGRRGEEGEFPFIDRSTVYTQDEPAIVDAVYRLRNAVDSEFGIVKLRYERPAVEGSKLSSRAGNKSIIATVLPQSDMPYNEAGICPDLIINPHSIPTRMTVGQMLETTQALVCQERGVLADGTFFRPFDVHAAEKELLAHGLRYNGTETLFNGRTGRYFDVAIFVGPTYHQLLQKFVQDDEYAAGSWGPTDALTGQPLDGKNAHGGLRLGEMEHWVLESHGAMMNLHEKTSLDSDGRTEYVCRTCGRQGIYNSRAGIYRCRWCGELANIVGIPSGKASGVFRQEVQAANISVRLGVRPPEFEVPLPPAPEAAAPPAPEAAAPPGSSSGR